MRDQERFKKALEKIAAFDQQMEPESDILIAIAQQALYKDISWVDDQVLEWYGDRLD